MAAFSGGQLNSKVQSTARKAWLSSVNSILGVLLALANSIAVVFPCIWDDNCVCICSRYCMVLCMQVLIHCVLIHSQAPLWPVDQGPLWPSCFPAWLQGTSMQVWLHNLVRVLCIVNGSSWESAHTDCTSYKLIKAAYLPDCAPTLQKHFALLHSQLWPLHR